MRDNTVDIFAEYLRMQPNCTVENSVLIVGGVIACDLVGLANWLEIKEKRGERFTESKSP